MKKEETLEEFIERHGITKQTLIDVYEEYVKNALIEFNSQKMYSEEEVELILNFVNDNYYKDGNGWIPNYKDDWITTKELLEIFKKK